MHPPDIAAAAQEEEEVEFSIPLEEIVSLVAAVATAARSSSAVAAASSSKGSGSTSSKAATMWVPTSFDEPFLQRAVITLHGSPVSKEIPLYGAAVIGCRSNGMPGLRGHSRASSKWHQPRLTKVECGVYHRR